MPTASAWRDTASAAGRRSRPRRATGASARRCHWRRQAGRARCRSTCCANRSTSAGAARCRRSTWSPAAKRMVVLEDADHLHFCDRVEETHELFRTMPQDPLFEDIQKAIPPITELVPGERAHLAIRGLAAAHLDAHLRGDAAAARLLAGDVRTAKAERGAAAVVLRPAGPGA